ncbi:hypothetical protein K0817_004390 [Microbacterium sp. HD4P20]|uniref:hypothetical protein n=1 Tax=Microbacterium sp. HD4P20 TaxID=2864874 RepID=UPI001C64393C|nr:hypothetical protein [Microbacterium sp. HD4P20]MCP2635805.1 hypothetical protein [Microbacterium sp. HD4P20]
MTTSTARLPHVHRRTISPLAAFVLTVAGHILVLGILAAGTVGVAVAAFAVFGSSILEAM